MPSSLPKPYTLIGLMSGTSVDGVDACCTRFWAEPATSSKKFKVQHQTLATYSHPMPQDLRERLLALMREERVSLAEVSALHVEVAELFAETVTGLLHTHGIEPASMDAIASHGQTVYHQPPLILPSLTLSLGTKAPLSPSTDPSPLKGEGVCGNGHTLQLGQPQVIAERTGIRTISDFRPRDMAVGGHGAPLVCLADAWLLGSADEGRCVQNIGGIANVTVLPANPLPIHESLLRGQGERGVQSDVFAFDTGPGNMLIDAAMAHFYQQPYDRDGEVAATGQIKPTLLAELLADSYFAEPPPKSTGRERFGQPMFARLLNEHPNITSQDWIATLTRFTAESITDAYRRFVFPVCDIQTMIIGGGGGRNITLMRWLCELLAPIKVLPHEAFGIDSQYKEALAFALLGWATLNGLPGNLPRCTGATQPVVLGSVIPAGNETPDHAA